MVTPMFKPAVGGAEECVYQLSRRLREKGHDVVVYTSDLLKMSPHYVHAEKQYDQFFGVDVRRFQATRMVGNYPAVLGAIPKLLVQRMDIVHAHVFGAFITDAAALISGVRKTPFVFSPHGFLGALSEHPLRHAYMLLSRLNTLRIARKIICNSRADAQYYRMLTDPKKIEIIPNGVDLDWIAFGEKRTFSDQRLLKGPVIASVGRVTKSKGFQYLIQALPIVSQQFPEAKVVIAGEDFGFLGDLRQLAHDAGVEKSVIFARLSREEIKGLYMDCDIVAIPSIYEGFPLVALEAMACGKPLVASDVGGLRDIIVPNMNGLLVPPADPEKLAGAIISLIQNEHLSRDIGRRNACEAKKYSWDMIVDRIEAVYQEACPNP